MNNVNGVLTLSKTILKLYANLIKLESENKIDQEYYDNIELLKFLLEKEDNYYKKMGKIEFKFIENYIADNITEECDDFYKINSDNFYETAIMTDENIKRILGRQNIYLNMYKTNNDMNWYDGIFNGVYFPRKDDKYGYGNYLSVFSLYMMVNEIKFLKHFKEKSNVLYIMNKYIMAYSNPFLEKYLVEHDFKEPENDDKYIKLANTINNIPKFKLEMNELFDEEFDEIITEIISGNFNIDEGLFNEALMGMDSLLSILNDEDKYNIYKNACEYVNDNGIKVNPKMGKFFDLFDKKKEDVKIKKINKNNK